MSRKFLTSIDLNKNELQNAVLQPLASAPSSPTEGQMYYNTVDDIPYIYANGVWISMSGGTGITNLGATLSATQTVITSSTGTSATIPAADTTNAGVMTKAMFDKLTGIEALADVTDAANVAAAGAIMDSDFSTNGLMGRTASGTYVSRTLTGTANLITVTNGDGVSGNPTITVGSNVYQVGGTDVSVADGGTGRSTGTTAYALIATGTTATGAQQTLAAGATTEILVGGGAAALPVWTTATGSGAPVRATSPTLTTPNLGTPSAVTLTNGTGLPESGVTNLVSDLAAKAPLASPTFTGTVTVPTPSGGTDAANKTYVDNAVQGLSWKQAVRVASTANVTIASALVNASTMDGVTLATGDRVLLKDQSTGSQNGIYIVAASGAASRATDADTSAEVDSMSVFVEAGTVNADTVWALTTNDPVLGTTALVFAQVNGGTVPAASTSVAGKVQLATQAEAQAKTDSAKALTAASVADFARKYTGTIGNGALTDIPVTHGLGSQYVTAQVFDATSGAQVEADVVLTSSTVVTFSFAVAPTTNQYRVVITG